MYNTAIEAVRKNSYWTGNCFATSLPSQHVHYCHFCVSVTCELRVVHLVCSGVASHRVLWSDGNIGVLDGYGTLVELWGFILLHFRLHFTSCLLDDGHSTWTYATLPCDFSLWLLFYTFTMTARLLKYLRVWCQKCLTLASFAQPPLYTFIFLVCCQHIIVNHTWIIGGFMYRCWYVIMRYK